MKTSIKIVQRDNDSTDYLKLIVESLNKQFTNQESTGQRWQLNCLDVAQELGGKVMVGSIYLTFDFTEIGR